MPLITTTTLHRVCVPVILDSELLFQHFNTYEYVNDETIITSGGDKETLYRHLKNVVEQMLVKHKLNILNKLNSELARLLSNNHYGDSSLWGGRYSI